MTPHRSLQNTQHRAAPAGLRTLLLGAAALALASLACAAEPSINYVVQPGDELIKMAEQSFQSPDDWQTVAKRNRLKNPNAIHPGQVLKIPLSILKTGARDGILLSVSGQVLLSGQPAQVGSAVPEGARLQTGASSSAQLGLADGSRITLMPNTDTTLVSSQGIALAGVDAKAGANWFTGLLQLSKGALDVLAAKLVKRNTPLQFQTPTSVVGVRGTEFRVAYDDPASQNARTEVLAGLVRADSLAHKVGAELPAGTGTVLNPVVQRVKVSALLKAPKLAARAVVVKPGARWPMPVLAGAERFKVQVSGHKDFSNVVREFSVDRSGQADFSDLPNGVWQLRVRGIDADTLEGFNATTSLHVMLPASPGQAPVEWAMRDSRIDVRHARHVLSFEPHGLDQSHSIVVNVKVDRAPFVRVAKALIKPDGRLAQLDLGELMPGQAYQLNLTVAQADGATLTPINYRFVANSQDGLTALLLSPLASEPPARAPVRKRRAKAR